MKHLYGKCCASLGLRRQPTLMSFYNYVYQRLTHHPESYVDNMLAPKKRVSDSPGYESELRQWWQSEGHRKKRKQRHDRMWEKHLAAFLKLKDERDPKNTESKKSYLSVPLYKWWANQRSFYKVYLDGGELDTGQMTRERADKLVAAGTVGEKNTWEKNLAAFLHYKDKFDPHNNKPKKRCLPKSVHTWWIDQRVYYCKHLDEEGACPRMTKERVDKLLAAGVLKSLRWQVPPSSHHQVTSPQPQHPLVHPPHCGNSAPRRNPLLPQNPQDCALDLTKTDWENNLACLLKKDAQCKNHVCLRCHLPRSLVSWYDYQLSGYCDFKKGKASRTMTQCWVEKLKEAGVLDRSFVKRMQMTECAKHSKLQSHNIPPPQHIQGPLLPTPQHQQPPLNFGFQVPPKSCHQVSPPPPQHRLVHPPLVYPPCGGISAPRPHPPPPHFSHVHPPMHPPQHRLVHPPLVYPPSGGISAPRPHPPPPHFPQWNFSATALPSSTALSTQSPTGASTFWKFSASPSSTSNPRDGSIQCPFLAAGGQMR